MSELNTLFEVTEVELIYRNKQKPNERPRIGTSRDAYNILRRAWDENKIGLLEEFKILLMNRGNKCLGVSHISTGTIAGCLADPKIIMATALKSAASGIILAHNHPSGQLKPSQADINLTEKLVNAGQFLDLPVLDHIILVPGDEYYSFGDDSRMPSLSYG